MLMKRVSKPTSGARRCFAREVPRTRIRLWHRQPKQCTRFKFAAQLLVNTCRCILSTRASICIILGASVDQKMQCIIARLQDGWKETNLLKVFLTATSHLEGSKLLIFDGQNSHLSTQVVKLALENNTELFCLPAHTSSILQPLDVGVFKTVKGAWRKCLRKYYDETRYSNVDKKA